MSAFTQEWARRLLAKEAAMQGNPLGPGDEIEHICHKLRVTLTPFIGPDGFAALLRRSVALARVDVPGLRTVKVTADGRLEGTQNADFEQRAGNAAIAITAHLLGLLITFIGEPLAVRLINNAWPGASGRLSAESEEF